jgi:hypothetical protein
MTDPRKLAEHDNWLTPFEGSGTEWHESLPSPYTYQESDFSKLVAAVHEYEADRDRLREALERIANAGRGIPDWRSMVDEARAALER